MQYYPNGHNDHLDNILNLSPNIYFLMYCILTLQIGYEISFNKYFYRHKFFRDLEEVSSNILA